MFIEKANHFPGGTRYPNSGGSHITTQQQDMGSHFTVDVGGLKQGGNLGVHVPIDNSGNVGQPDFFHKPAFEPVKPIGLLDPFKMPDPFQR